MKASDLMVGDWVWNEFNKKAEKVSSIMDNLIMLDYNDCYNPEEPIDEIEPIPLTVEILEKNGFDGYYGSKFFDLFKYYDLLGLYKTRHYVIFSKFRYLSRMLSGMVNLNT